MHAPPEVHAAFRDVASAQEDKQTSINVAYRYLDETVNLARGEAARTVAEAQSFATREVHRARGESESPGHALSRVPREAHRHVHTALFGDRRGGSRPGNEDHPTRLGRLGEDRSVDLVGQGHASSRSGMSFGAARFAGERIPAIRRKRESELDMNRLRIVIPATIVVLVLIVMSFFTVDVTETAVVTQFGNPVAVVTEAGLRTKIPFVQQVRRFDARLQVLEPPTRPSSSRRTRRTSS